jgi:hypothetical protein
VETEAAAHAELEAALVAVVSDCGRLRKEARDRELALPLQAARAALLLVLACGMTGEDVRLVSARLADTTPTQLAEMLPVGGFRRVVHQLALPWYTLVEAAAGGGSGTAAGGKASGKGGAAADAAYRAALAHVAATGASTLAAPQALGVWGAAIASFARSCVPNCLYFCLGDVMFIVAARDILPGEGLTIPLAPQRLPYAQRSLLLMARGQPQCGCALCATQAKAEREPPPPAAPAEAPPPAPAASKKKGGKAAAAAAAGASEYPSAADWAAVRAAMRADARPGVAEATPTVPVRVAAFFDRMTAYLQAAGRGAFVEGPAGREAPLPPLPPRTDVLDPLWRAVAACLHFLRLRRPADALGHLERGIRWAREQPALAAHAPYLTDLAAAGYFIAREAERTPAAATGSGGGGAAAAHARAAAMAGFGVSPSAWAALAKQCFTYAPPAFFALRYPEVKG